MVDGRLGMTRGHAIRICRFPLECSAQSSQKLRDFFLRNASSSFRIAILVAFLACLKRNAGYQNDQTERQCFTQ